MELKRGPLQRARIARMKLPRVEIVVWLDSGVSVDGWVSYQDVETMKPSEVVSVGFLILEKDDYIQIAESMNLGDGVKPLGHVFAIAKIAIRSRKVLIPEKDYK